MSGRRAVIIGTGLIGGSIGLALRAQGWTVTGTDEDPGRSAEALERGAVDRVGEDPDADITFVATPVGGIATAARRALANGARLVTDVGGVKAPIVAAVADPRFVGGHPMAGSELDGVAGADPDLFGGATWVLTPDPQTADDAFTQVRAVVSLLGAEVVTLDPARHDSLVAMVSHVPHLTAATLMRLADERATEHRALLRLAAGGFRDMTRIASGQPEIWPDVCAENRIAIVTVLDELVGALADVRDLVDGGDRDGLLAVLRDARRARVNLPSRVVRPELVSEVRVPVSDRPGELARITSLAAELDVSIADLEISHSAEGERGVVVLLVERDMAERYLGGLLALGYRPQVVELS